MADQNNNTSSRSGNSKSENNGPANTQAQKASSKKSPFFSRIYLRIMKMVRYCTVGVWNDPSQSFKVRLIKTLNLSINSFLDRGLQLRSMALTYYMVLALVPALALLVAIARGFGLSDSMQDELYSMFPSQHKVISVALSFVDSYLSEASSGIFVGVGLVMLLWTVISLLSYIEDAFNTIWDIKGGRNFYQKLTDYISICLIIPILMICSSGVSIFMSTTFQDNLILPFLSPLVNFFLELAPIVFAWLAFSFSFFLIPSTKVNFKYAAISGAVCAIAFQILQLLFVNGQIYVSKYNAIYGSFAFLPLLLVWLQLSWMILLAGCVLTYSLQNVFTFNFLGTSSQVSINNLRAVGLITMAVIIKRFLDKQTPLSSQKISTHYNLPVRLVNHVVEKLQRAHLVYVVKLEDNAEGLTPAVEVSTLTLGKFLHAFDNIGDQTIIPDFNIFYSGLIQLLTPLRDKAYAEYDSILVADIPLPSPLDIRHILMRQSNS